MYNEHVKKYPDFNNNKRLSAMKTNPFQINYMSKTLRENKKRESKIEQEDIDSAVELIMNNPMIGGEKISCTLLDSQDACISGGTANSIKMELKELFAERIFAHGKEIELAKSAKDREPKPEWFEDIKPLYLHHIWSTDYTEVTILGIKFAIAEIYENHSQGYLAAEIDFASKEEIAITAIEEAVIFTGGKKPELLRSDNGSQFTGDSFTSKLKELSIEPQLTPAGKPWYNGALESGNRNLKNEIFSTIGLDIGDEPNLIKENIEKEEVLKIAKQALKEAMININENIARPKFGTTPINILKGIDTEKITENNKYKKEKQIKRKNNHPNGGGPFTEKIKKALDKIIKIKNISMDKIFAIDELINYRTKFITT